MHLLQLCFGRIFRGTDGALRGAIDRGYAGISSATRLKMGAEIPEPVDSIYLGGGTPSLLPAEELKKLFFAVRQEFKVLPKAEITVECAPGTLTDPSHPDAGHARRKSREPGRAVVCGQGSGFSGAAAYAGEDAERHRAAAQGRNQQHQC